MGHFSSASFAQGITGNQLNRMSSGGSGCYSKYPNEWAAVHSRIGCSFIERHHVTVSATGPPQIPRNFAELESESGRILFWDDELLVLVLALLEIPVECS